MPDLEQLHFQRLPPEAQRATLWRLAWTGMAPEQIAIRVGWSAEQVRRTMDEELQPAQPRMWWRNGGLQVMANA